MKLAAIDIGSNAIRLQIVKVYQDDSLVSFKKLEFLRFPLRLGHDVFKKERISEKTQDKFIKLMTVFKSLMDLYEVEGYYAVATSAMREAENGEETRAMAKGACGLVIDIIAGEEEANILNKAIIPYLTKDYTIHIDVGGGSTEINLFKEKQIIQGQSFRIGSVRKLSSAVRKETFDAIKQWIKNSDISKITNVQAIGTGGNINKIAKVANQDSKKSISFAELKALRAYIREFSLQERMNILKMNPDRADVIIPASEIYINAMGFAKSDRILVPRVGLKDGLVYKLFERLTEQELHEFEFLGHN